MLRVNRRRKLRTLTLIHPVVNPNIHELTYCHKLGSRLNLSVSGSASPATVLFQVQMSRVLPKQQHGGLKNPRQPACFITRHKHDTSYTGPQNMHNGSYNTCTYHLYGIYKQ